MICISWRKIIFVLVGPLYLSVIGENVHVVLVINRCDDSSRRHAVCGYDSDRTNMIILASDFGPLGLKHQILWKQCNKVLVLKNVHRGPRYTNSASLIIIFCRLESTAPVYRWLLNRRRPLCSVNFYLPRKLAGVRVFHALDLVPNISYWTLEVSSCNHIK